MFHHSYTQKYMILEVSQIIYRLIYYKIYYKQVKDIKIKHKEKIKN